MQLTRNKTEVWTQLYRTVKSIFMPYIKMTFKESIWPIYKVKMFFDSQITKESLLSTD